jgi:hypothetical protein
MLSWSGSQADFLARERDVCMFIANDASIRLHFKELDEW